MKNFITALVLLLAFVLIASCVATPEPAENTILAVEPVAAPAEELPDANSAASDENWEAGEAGSEEVPAEEAETDATTAASEPWG